MAFPRSHNMNDDKPASGPSSSDWRQQSLVERVRVLVPDILGFKPLLCQLLTVKLGKLTHCSKPHFPSYKMRIVCTLKNCCDIRNIIFHLPFRYQRKRCSYWVLFEHIISSEDSIHRSLVQTTILPRNNYRYFQGPQF